MKLTNTITISITSPSADMVRLGVKIKVQSSIVSRTKKKSKKMFELTPSRCVPSFKSLAQV